VNNTLRPLYLPPLSAPSSPLSGCVPPARVKWCTYISASHCLADAEDYSETVRPDGELLSLHCAGCHVSPGEEHNSEFTTALAGLANTRIGGQVSCVTSHFTPTL